jgi:hypothetical protein
MLFFQASLLAGYAYAHGLGRVRRPWVQVPELARKQQQVRRLKVKRQRASEQARQQPACRYQQRTVP